MGKFLAKTWTTFWKIPRVFGSIYTFLGSLVVVRSNGEFVPITTFVLIGVNSALFCLGFHQEFNIFSAPTYLIGSLFSHASLDHLAGNMLFLLLFAPKCEKRLNHFPFLLFYLIVGCVSSLVFSILTPNAMLIGASGAIAGCLGLFTFLQNSLLSQLVNIGVLGVYIYLQVSSMIQALSIGFMSGTAYLVHVLGFFIGVFVWTVRRIERSVPIL